MCFHLHHEDTLAAVVAVTIRDATDSYTDICSYINISILAIDKEHNANQYIDQNLLAI